MPNMLLLQAFLWDPIRLTLLDLRIRYDYAANCSAEWSEFNMFGKANPCTVRVDSRVPRHRHCQLLGRV